MEQTQDSSFQTQRSLSSRSRNPKRTVFIVIAILIVIALGFGVRAFLSSQKGSEEESKKEEQPVVKEAPTDIPTPRATISATVKPTTLPTSKPTQTPIPKPTSDPVDKKTGLNRSSLSVEVLNGSGVSGVAGKASDILKTAGYNVTSVGNADHYEYQGAVIQVKSSKEPFIALLKQDLQSSYTIGSASASLSATSSADAVVIVGK